MVQLSSGDRLVAAAVCAWFCYRLVTALQIGIYYGDGDMDVHADRHPTAFVLTALSSILVIVLCGILASGLDSSEISAALMWLSKTFR